MKTKIIKLTVFALLFSIIFSTFTACQSAPIKTGKKSLSVVGTVDSYDIPYDEFYFLVNNYRATLDSVYGDNASTSGDVITVTDDNGVEKSVKLSDYYAQRLTSLVYENIVSNYSILKLCEEAGLSLDSDYVKEATQTTLDAYIQSEFDGKRSEYKKYLKENGTTDRYVRFSLGIDILYSQLAAEYVKSGILKNDDAAVREIIENDFVRTWHIMILDENGSQENYERAQEALQKIQNGATMYEMIGSKYNQDFSLTTIDGYYFTRGGMDPAYEEAAYSLEVGEVSGVVKSIGKNMSGDRVDCYYIIQRLELEDQYINNNFETLKKDYHDSTIFSMVETLEDSLKFVPNEFCESLDIVELDMPTQHDPVVIVTVTAIILGVGGISAITVIFLRKRAKKLNKGKNEK